MEFIIIGLILIIISTAIHSRMPRFIHGPTRVRGVLVDYSFGRREAYAGIAAKCPEQYERAALALLGPAAYDAVYEDAVRAAQACAAEVGSLELGPNQPQPPGIYFKEGEPHSLSEYHGQEPVVDYLSAVVEGTPASQIIPRDHQLLLGPAGLGKTLLAKCFANSLRLRNERLGHPPVVFQEEFPADLATLRALDDAVREASLRPTVLFIDEIHDLKSEAHSLKLYLLLEEGRYKFEDEEFPVELPDILVVGATTDSGMMHPALQRRFNRQILQPLAKKDIVDIVAHGRGMPITPEAAVAVVERTHFSGGPWEAIQLYQQAVHFARQRGSEEVCVQDIEHVFDTQKIDPLGLRWMDRAVIQALLGQPKFRGSRTARNGQEFVCYAASEADTCAIARVDKGEYRESIKPRLMARGLLQVRTTYGQALTPDAVSKYGWLVKS